VRVLVTAVALLMRRWRAVLLLAPSAVAVFEVSEWLISDNVATMELTELRDQLQSIQDSQDEDGVAEWFEAMQAEFAAIDWSVDLTALGILAAASVIYLVGGIVHGAAIVKVSISELDEEPCSLVEAVRWGIRSIPRVISTAMRMFGIAVAIVSFALAVTVGLFALGLALIEVIEGVAITVVFVAVLLMVSVTLSMIGAMMLAPAPVAVALVGASVGSAESKGGRSWRLLKGHFWRSQLTIYMLIAVTVFCGLMSELLSFESSLAVRLVSSVFGWAFEWLGFCVLVSGATVLYHDLRSRAETVSGSRAVAGA